MNKCFVCKAETKNPKYCSRSCAAKHSNKTPKRKRNKRCIECNTLILSTNRKRCPECIKDYVPVYKKNMEKDIQKECSKHGVCRWRLEGRGYYRCTKCRQDAVQRKRRKLKQDLVEYKGGKCEMCGYNQCYAAMDFHHKDPSQKDFSVSSSGCTRGLEKCKREVDKCMLLCSNCHRELHSKEHDRI